MGSSSEEPTKLIRARNRRGEGLRLREDIIEAATRLLSAYSQPDPLSLRAVAREVGITAQSMYLHFSEKSDLIYAVMERRFGELATTCDRAAREASQPAGRLRARCLAYCRWGMDTPGHYRLLFETKTTGQAGIAYPESPGAAVFSSFVAAVHECMQAGAAQPGDPVEAATGLWIGLHGIVSLRLSKPGFPWPPVEQLVDRVLDRMVRLTVPTGD